MLRLVALSSLVALAAGAVNLRELFSWNVLDWEYPDDFARQQALFTGALIPENALPVGIERWQDKLFVSVPRWRAGIPATLNYVSLSGPHQQTPKLIPYPSWEANELGNCQSGLNTVYRIKADKCDRLWVLDTGTYGYDPNVTNLCPYSVNVFDLRTNTRIRRFDIPADNIVPTTFIANIALDMGGSCDDTFAYFSDELGYGLIAYSWQQNRSWRFSHNFFQPDPLLGNFNIAGLNFNWGTEGIFGITASPIGNDGFRTLYFSPLASNTEFAVSTRILRNESKTTDNYFDFRVVGRRSNDGHTTAKVMSDRGVQLFNLIDQNSIGCWSSALPLKPQNTGVVDKDDVGLVFPSDVKIDEEDNVWVMSDRMPVFLEAELDYSDINFRVYTAPLDTLLKGSVCEPPTSKFYQPAKGLQLNQFAITPRPIPLFNIQYNLQAFSPNPQQIGVYTPNQQPFDITRLQNIQNTILRTDNNPNIGRQLNINNPNIGRQLNINNPNVGRQLNINNPNIGRQLNIPTAVPILVTQGFDINRLPNVPNAILNTDNVSDRPLNAPTEGPFLISQGFDINRLPNIPNNLVRTDINSIAPPPNQSTNSPIFGQQEVPFQIYQQNIQNKQNTFRQRPRTYDVTE